MGATNVDIRHLRAFLAVAEASSFTRAAQRLKVSQPSISLQIKDLEAALGTTLFDRLGGRIVLTEPGAAFRDHAEVVIRKLEEACQSVDRIKGLVSGHLEIGVIPALTVAWIPPLLGHFAKNFPGVTVTVHVRSSSEVETEVEAGRYDVGLGFLSYASPNVRYERLCTTSFTLVVPPRHPWSARKSVALAELWDQRLVLFPETYNIRQMINDLLQRANVRPRVVFEIDTIDAVLATVALSGALTILPSIVLQGRSRHALRSVPLVGKHQTQDMGMLWPRGSKPNATANAFAAFMAQLAAGE